MLFNIINNVANSLNYTIYKKNECQFRCLHMHKLNDLQKATFMTFTVVDQNEKKVYLNVTDKVNAQKQRILN